MLTDSDVQLIDNLIKAGCEVYAMSSSQLASAPSSQFQYMLPEKLYRVTGTRTDSYVSVLFVEDEDYGKIFHLGDEPLGVFDYTISEFQCYSYSRIKLDNESII